MPMPAALFRREVELREHHLREQARQHSTHAPRPASIFDTAPRARPVARRAPPARASARALVLVMAISMCLCPLTQPEVREALRSQGKVALQHPALREGSLRVTRLLRSLAGMPVQVPALPELRQSER